MGCCGLSILFLAVFSLFIYNRRVQLYVSHTPHFSRTLHVIEMNEQKFEETPEDDKASASTIALNASICPSRMYGIIFILIWVLA